MPAPAASVAKRRRPGSEWQSRRRPAGARADPRWREVAPEEALAARIRRWPISSRSKSAAMPS
jgi:hypothetical protein